MRADVRNAESPGVFGRFWAKLRGADALPGSAPLGLEHDLDRIDGAPPARPYGLEARAPVPVLPARSADGLGTAGRQSKIDHLHLVQVGLQALPQLLAQEYRTRVAELESHRLAPEERSRRVLSLFRDYCRALWAEGQSPEIARVGDELLDVLERTRSGGMIGRRSYNGLAWGAAQSLVLGIDPHAFPARFELDPALAGEQGLGALYRARLGVPALEREVIEVEVQGTVVRFSRAEAQALIDRELPKIAAGESRCGFRFDRRPQQVVMHNGEVRTGFVSPELFDDAAMVRRLGGDLVALCDTPYRPLLGVLALQIKTGVVEMVPVAEVSSLSRDQQSGLVQVRFIDPFREPISGSLTTPVPWDRGTQRGDRLVLEQDHSLPIRGEIKLEQEDGTTALLPADQIEQVVGEVQKDLPLSELLAWLSRHGGVYAVDDAGQARARWVSRIEQETREGEDRPEWMPGGELGGIRGALVREDGDRLAFLRGRYAPTPGAEPSETAFAGWVQVGKSGRILNEGFTAGRPDYAWTPEGPLDWSRGAPLVVALLVNGLRADAHALDALAARLNLPIDYRSLLRPQAGEDFS